MRVMPESLQGASGSFVGVPGRGALSLFFWMPEIPSTARCHRGCRRGLAGDDMHFDLDIKEALVLAPFRRDTAHASFSFRRDTAHASFSATSDCLRRLRCTLHSIPPPHSPASLPLVLFSPSQIQDAILARALGRHGQEIITLPAPAPLSRTSVMGDEGQQQQRPCSTRCYLVDSFQEERKVKELQLYRKSIHASIAANVVKMAFCTSFLCCM